MNAQRGIEMRRRRCELCGYEPAMYGHYLCRDCFDDEEEYYANKEREKEMYEEMERELYEEMEKEDQAKTEQVASDADGDKSYPVFGVPAKEEY